MEVYVISVETGLTVWHGTYLNTCRILHTQPMLVRSMHLSVFMVFNPIFSSPQIFWLIRRAAEIKQLYKTR